MIIITFVCARRAQSLFATNAAHESTCCAIIDLILPKLATLRHNRENGRTHRADIIIPHRGRRRRRRRQSFESAIKTDRHDAELGFEFLNAALAAAASKCTNTRQQVCV